jgi:hypothetical protein
MLWTSAIVSAVTGLVYAAIRYLMTSDDPFSAFNHPAQPWALDAHLLIAPVLLFAIGWFWGNHVTPKLQRKMSIGRPSGLVLLGLVVVMTASGYLLQTIVSPFWKTFTGWTHGISGTLFVGILIGHQIAARRAYARRRVESGKPRSVTALVS